jgi:hypothetical protein
MPVQAAQSARISTFKCHHKPDVAVDAKVPPDPTVARCIAFDVAKGGSQVAPPPVPAHPPVPRADPVLIELDRIELGATLAFVSISDNPDAPMKYEAIREWMMKGEDAGAPPVPVFELPLFGYDQNQSRATVLLDFEAMEKKGIKPGEEIAIFQVDKNGNVSKLPAETRIDPNQWARNQIQTTNDAGRAVNVPGAQLDFQKGIHGVDGMDFPQEQRGVMQRVLGVAVADREPPVRVDKQINVRTFEWTKSEKSVADHLLNAPGVWNTINQQMQGSMTREKIEAAVKQADANPARSPYGERTLDAFRVLLKEPAMLERMDQAANGPGTKDGIIAQVDLQEVVNKPMTAFLALEFAYESGVNGSVKVGTDHVQEFAIDASRKAYLKMPDGFATGDAVVVEARDHAGNPAPAYSFEYSQSSKTGKLGDDLLAMQGRMMTDVTPRKISVSGKEVKLVPNGLAPGELRANGTLCWRAGDHFVVNEFAQQYETNAAALGLPKGNQVAIQNGAEQQFEKGKMVLQNGAVTVTLN